MKRFYKKGISLFLILLMSFPLCACKSDDSKTLTTVKLNEVAHSIFYAPMYVAIEKGYFEDEGIELSLTTGFGADKTMAAVVSGDADVGFMGTEASIYAYTEGAKDLSSILHSLPSVPVTLWLQGKTPIPFPMKI